MASNPTQTSRLLDPLPVPAYLWDLTTEKFIAADPAMLGLVGYTEDELRHLDWRDLIHSDEIATAERAIEVGPTSVRWRWRREDEQVITVTLASRQMTSVGLFASSLSSSRSAR